ncbi:MAG TPA: metalloregulator ArsR/SmtB family transcription factor [Ktedonobacterales bacterium]
MSESDQLVILAQALADPVRLGILQHLMAGPATVSELQSLTGVSQSNVSNHLALLRERDLVRAAREGRHIIYALRDASVGHLVESLTVVAGMVPVRLWKSPQLVAARTCYDHLAGRYSVALFDALLALEAIKEPGAMHAEVELGARGEEVFGKLGLNLSAVRRERRRFAFACPDWTERRPHLGGSLGAALWATCVEHGWVVKQQGTRAIVVTDLGKQQFWEQLGVQMPLPEGA